MATLTKDQTAALRARFKTGETALRPVITCPACTNGGRCNAHKWEPCSGCGATTSTAHDHHRYIEQAQVRARLDDVDPGWSWEPMALTEQGLPAVDQHGGLWIRLTVCGVTRIGYGAPDAGRTHQLNESISRAIRLTARNEFGVGAYLDGERQKNRAKSTKTNPAKPATPAPAVVDVPLPFEDETPAGDPRDVQQRRDDLRKAILEYAQNRGKDLTWVATDFLGFSEGKDFLSPHSDPDELDRFFKYLRHPEPQAVA